MRVPVASIAVTLLGAAAANEIFVDAGACPGEGCVYGEQWIARKAIELHASPSESFQPGDEVLLYTYLGEGGYQVRHEKPGPP